MQLPWLPELLYRPDWPWLPEMTPTRPGQLCTTRLFVGSAAQETGSRSPRAAWHQTLVKLPLVNIQKAMESHYF